MVNIATIVWSHADSDDDLIAFRSPREISYRQLRETTARIAGAVRATGIEPLDRVLFIAPTISEFPEVYYGLHVSGATVITMNTMSTVAEIDYVLGDSEPKLVIAWHASSEAARIAAQQRGIDFWEVREGSELVGAPSESTPVTTPHEHAPDDTAIILYTSGTTGKPKGAELTASNLVDTAASFLPVLTLDSSSRFGTALPLFHVYGQAVCMNTALSVGASFSLLSPFDPAKMLEMMRRDRLTVLAGVPTMWNAMLHVQGDFTPSDFESLEMATSGGAPIPVEVIRAFTARFGCTILEGYGLTESTGAATFNDINKPQKPGTVGPPLPGSSIEIRRPDGSAADVDETGEVFIIGPTVMKGYWNRPDATAADLDGNALRTGDLGSLDADGYLRIVDRAKDLIIRGGYNVYPREVEEVLYEHPDIVEVAVVGVPDDHYGEEVAAVITLAPGAVPDPDAVKAWAKERLSAYKVPRLYSFVDALPKGATGKILKRAIDRDALVASAPAREPSRG